MNKIYLIGAGVVALLLAAVGLWLYIDHQDAKIDDLTRTVASQAITIEQDKQALDVMRKDVQGLKTLTDTFNKQIAGIQANSTQVTTKLNSKAYQSAVKADPAKAATDISQAVNGLFSDVNAATGVSNAK